VIFGRGTTQYVSPHVLLDCRQLYIDTSHFCHAAPSGIGHDFSVRNEYLSTYEIGCLRIVFCFVLFFVNQKEDGLMAVLFFSGSMQNGDIL